MYPVPLTISPQHPDLTIGCRAGRALLYWWGDLPKDAGSPQGSTDSADQPVGSVSGPGTPWGAHRGSRASPPLSGDLVEPEVGYPHCLLPSPTSPLSPHSPHPIPSPFLSLPLGPGIGITHTCAHTHTFNMTFLRVDLLNPKVILFLFSQHTLILFWGCVWGCSGPTQ